MKKAGLIPQKRKYRNSTVLGFGKGFFGKDKRKENVKKVRKNRRVIFPPVLLQFFRHYICVLDPRMVSVTASTYNSRHYICVLDA